LKKLKSLSRGDSMASVNKKKCDTCPYIQKIESDKAVTANWSFWSCDFTKRKDKIIPFKCRKSSPTWCPFRKRLRRQRKGSPRALLVKELDELFRQVVRQRAGYKCEITGQEDGEGQGKVLNVHHFIGRTNFRVRWDPDNGVLLTAGKHTLSSWSAHKNPTWFTDQMILKRGAKWLQLLKRKAGSMGGAIKHSIPELKEIKIELEKELNGK
jgi:hypothetical protein